MENVSYNLTSFAVQKFTSQDITNLVVEKLNSYYNDYMFLSILIFIFGTLTNLEYISKKANIKHLPILFNVLKNCFLGAVIFRIIMLSSIFKSKEFFLIYVIFITFNGLILIFREYEGMKGFLKWLKQKIEEKNY